jgi:hypothetical protein
VQRSIAPYRRAPAVRHPSPPRTGLSARARPRPTASTIRMHEPELLRPPSRTPALALLTRSSIRTLAFSRSLTHRPTPTKDVYHAYTVRPSENACLHRKTPATSSACAGRSECLPQSIFEQARRVGSMSAPIDLRRAAAGRRIARCTSLAARRSGSLLGDEGTLAATRHRRGRCGRASASRSARRDRARQRSCPLVPRRLPRAHRSSIGERVLASKAPAASSAREEAEVCPNRSLAESRRDAGSLAAGRPSHRAAPLPAARDRGYTGWPMRAQWPRCAFRYLLGSSRARCAESLAESDTRRSRSTPVVTPMPWSM